MLVKKLNLFILKFKLAPALELVGVPTVAVNDPLNPMVFDCFSTIFRIPAVPSASYRADGFVITSTFSIASPGNCLSASVGIPESAAGFPLIKIRTDSLPLRLIFPSISTLTEGTLSRTSVTDPPLTVISLPTL